MFIEWEALLIRKTNGRNPQSRIGCLELILTSAQTPITILQELIIFETIELCSFCIFCVIKELYYLVF